MPTLQDYAPLEKRSFDKMKLDIIGDIHGCFHEFHELTLKLGYQWKHGYS